MTSARLAAGLYAGFLALVLPGFLLVRFAEGAAATAGGCLFLAGFGLGIGLGHLSFWDMARRPRAARRRQRLTRQPAPSSGLRDWVERWREEQRPGAPVPPPREEWLHPTLAWSAAGVAAGGLYPLGLLLGSRQVALATPVALAGLLAVVILRGQRRAAPGDPPRTPR